MVRPTGEVGALLKEFVPVRMVQGNGMDLSLFQFDYDMSFAVFFIDADRTIYGRYGTRTQDAQGEADSEISLKGLAESMKAALALHRSRDKYAEVLKAKTGPEPEHPTPEAHAQLRKYEPKIQYGANVAKSCIHCHQMRDVERLEYRTAGKVIPESVLFPYPMPELLGLRFDKDTRATIESVLPDSPAAKLGLRRGDQVLTMNGQPTVSVADIQWVLEKTPAEGGTVKAKIAKADRKVAEVSFALASGWRRAGDISWRVSTWELRRQAFGGIRFEPTTGQERAKLRLGDGLALRAKHVGQYGDHARAKRAGALKGDVLIEFDSKRDDLSESQLIAHIMQQREPGYVLPVKVLRGGREVELKIRLP